MVMLTKIASPPPPIPWIVRAAMSIAILVLNAAIKDPTMKMMFARRSIGFLPKMSLILPQLGTLAALAKVNAAPIHVYPDVDWK
jgi:hypothetical protein